MNYLAHYYFDAETGKPGFNTGLLLPDLMRTFNPKWKCRFNKTKLERESSKNLLQGCCRHEERDLWFHSSPEFNQSLQEVKLAIKNELGLEHPYRPSFISHILVEIILDRLILKKSPTTLQLLYSDLAEMPYFQLELFFSESGLQNHEKFREFFSRFVSSKYLSTYSSNEHVIYALNRIFAKVKQPTLPENKPERLNSLIKTGEEVVATYYQKFL